MSATTSIPRHVEKEHIASLRFPVVEVISDHSKQTKRMRDLELATTLGNVDHGKITIVFEDDEGLKMVTTTIWATTDTRIILKGGVVIPISRIHEVRFL